MAGDSSAQSLVQSRLHMLPSRLGEGSWTVVPLLGKGAQVWPGWFVAGAFGALKSMAFRCSGWLDSWCWIEESVMQEACTGTGIRTA